MSKVLKISKDSIYSWELPTASDFGQIIKPNEFPISDKFILTSSYVFNKPDLVYGAALLSYPNDKIILHQFSEKADKLNVCVYILICNGNNSEIENQIKNLQDGDEVYCFGKKWYYHKNDDASFKLFLPEVIGKYPAVNAELFCEDWFQKFLDQLNETEITYSITSKLGNKVIDTLDTDDFNEAVDFIESQTSKNRTVYVRHNITGKEKTITIDDLIPK